MATQMTATTEQMERDLAVAFLASGIGSAVMGFMTTASEASADFAANLKWVAPVGPLSGKTTISVIAFLLSWVILHFAFAQKAPKLATAFTITLVLIALGLLLSFPPVFELFAPA